MSMQRRSFLRLSTVAAATVGGATLLGTSLASAAAPVSPLGIAPSTPFAVGVRQYSWTRGSRKINTYVYYPATGTAGGNPVTNAPVAAGVFPVYNFTHGLGSSPQNSLFIIRARRRQPHQFLERPALPQDRRRLGPLDHVRRHRRTQPPPRRRVRNQPRVGSPGG